MSKKTKPKTGAESCAVKMTPYPVRLNKRQEADLILLSQKTGINKGELMRAGLNYWLPRVLSGEISILESERK